MSELFRTGKVDISFSLTMRAITFTIEQDTLLVPPNVAKQYLKNIKNRRFRVVRGLNGSPHEMQTAVQGFIGDDMYEWEFSFPVAEIPHHVGLVEGALKALHDTLN